MKSNATKILFSPLFTIGLFLLLVNDFFLKAAFGNFLTGKLSDFAGLFIFPLFFAAFFPKRKLFIYILTAFLFVFWKSPFSQSLIDFINLLSLFRIGRTIDYSDYLALLIMPLSYFYLNIETQKQKLLPPNFAKRILASFVVLLSVFAFTATQLVKDRRISLNGQYELKLNKAKIENILKQNSKIQNLKIEQDSDKYWVDFSLKQKFCDSELPKFTFLVEQKKNLALIRAGGVEYECELYENNDNTLKLEVQHLEELNDIFESEVIEKLRQNISQ